MTGEFAQHFQQEWWGWTLRDDPAMRITMWQVSGGQWQVNYNGWVHAGGVSFSRAQDVAMSLLHMIRWTQQD